MKYFIIEKTELKLKKNLYNEIMQEINKIKKNIEIGREYAKEFNSKFTEKVCNFLYRKLNTQSKKNIKFVNEMFESTTKKLKRFTDKNSVSFDDEKFVENFYLSTYSAFKETVFDYIQDLNQMIQKAEYTCLLNSAEYAVSLLENSLEEVLVKSIKDIEKRINDSKTNNGGMEIC